MKVKEIFSSYWRGLLLGVIVGLSVYYFQPKVWKAQALVAPASYVTFTEGAMRIQLIESTNIISERIKTKSFIVAASKRLKTEQDPDHLGDAIEVNATRIRSPDEIPSLIISASAVSASVATDSLNAILAELQFKHEQILDEYKHGILSNLKVIDDQIATSSKNIEEMTDQKMHAGSVNSVSLISILQFALKEKKSEATRLLTFNIRNTELLEPIFLKEKSWFSSLFQAMAIGAILGLIVNIVWVRRKSWWG